MKTSIRNKRFTLGMTLFLCIILLLSVLSAFFLNKLSQKTNAILKENHYSVVFVRNMQGNLTNINQKIYYCYLANSKPDTIAIYNEFAQFDKMLKSEENNITEVGEEKLVSEISSDYNRYRDSIMTWIKTPESAQGILKIQDVFTPLNHKLIILSLMNEQAIENKTNDAKLSAKKATFQMTLTGTLCFLVAYGFTFMFSSYYNDRFYKLYNGIKESASLNYIQRVDLKGSDELSEISLIFNNMAENLCSNKTNISDPLTAKNTRHGNTGEVRELKNLLDRIKIIESQVNDLISRIEIN